MPVNISNYADSLTDVTVALHQGHHDAIHTTVNAMRVLMPSGGDDTAAIQAVIDASPTNGTAVLGPGTFLVASTLTFSDYTSLRGCGRRATTLQYSGSGTLLSIASHQNCTVADIGLTGTGTTWVLLGLSNAFNCDFDSVEFRGGHAPATPQPNQKGVTLRANAGDNTFRACKFFNLGVGIATSAIQNYVIGCMFVTCQRSVWGDAGSNNAGLSLESCTFTSSAAATIAHIQVDVAANLWWVSHCWFEGCTKGVVIGAGTAGPYNFGMVNCMVAATTTCIDIVCAIQTYIANVAFFGDGAATPTPLAMDATNALTGTAINIHTNFAYDFVTTIFPRGWTFLGRGQVRMPF